MFKKKLQIDLNHNKVLFSRKKLSPLRWPIPYLKEVRRIFESYFWTTCSEGRGKRRRRKEQNTFAPPEF